MSRGKYTPEFKVKIVLEVLRESGSWEPLLRRTI